MPSLHLLVKNWIVLFNWPEDDNAEKFHFFSAYKYISLNSYSMITYNEKWNIYHPNVCEYAMLDLLQIFFLAVVSLSPWKCEFHFLQELFFTFNETALLWILLQPQLECQLNLTLHQPKLGLTQRYSSSDHPPIQKLLL